MHWNRFITATTPHVIWHRWACPSGWFGNSHDGMRSIGFLVGSGLLASGLSFLPHLNLLCPAHGTITISLLPYHFRNRLYRSATTSTCWRVCGHALSRSASHPGGCGGLMTRGRTACGPTRPASFTIVAAGTAHTGNSFCSGMVTCCCNMLMPYLASHGKYC